MKNKIRKKSGSKFVSCILALAFCTESNCEYTSTLFKMHLKRFCIYHKKNIKKDKLQETEITILFSITTFGLKKSKKKFRVAFFNILHLY